MKSTFGLFLLTGLILIFSFTSQAKEHHRCKLFAIEDDTGGDPSQDPNDKLIITGHVKLDRANSGAFTLDLDYNIAMGDDKTDKTEKNLKVKMQPITAKEILESEEWEVLEGLFAGEKPKSGQNFQTPGYEEDGSGYSLTIVTGEKGTKKALIALGWMPAICQ